MSEQVPTEAEVVAGLARAAAAPVPLDPAVLYLTNHEDQHLLNLEQYRRRPDRATGTVRFTERASLDEYVNEHATNATKAYASRQGHGVSVVLNDHVAGAGEWGDWKAQLVLQESIPWKRWAAANGGWHSQEEFAEHIEEGLLEIVKPAGARMLEIVQSFHATNRATIDSAVRLDNGETQLKYVEQVQARAGQTKQFAIPEFIELALVPYEGGDAYKIRARFRYRLNGGNLLLGYKLERPEDVQRVAFDEIVATFQENTGVKLYFGSPR